MKDHIQERVLQVAEYISTTGATVRNTANKFQISKSTVHKDVSDRLKNINMEKAYEVNKVLQHNKSQRHIRGGNATYLKYKKQQEDTENNH